MFAFSPCGPKETRGTCLSRWDTTSAFGLCWYLWGGDEEDDEEAWASVAITFARAPVLGVLAAVVGEGGGRDH